MFRLYVYPVKTQLTSRQPRVGIEREITGGKEYKVILNFEAPYGRHFSCITAADAAFSRDHKQIVAMGKMPVIEYKLTNNAKKRYYSPKKSLRIPLRRFCQAGRYHEERSSSYSADKTELGYYFINVIF